MRKQIPLENLSVTEKMITLQFFRLKNEILALGIIGLVLFIMQQLLKNNYVLLIFYFLIVIIILFFDLYFSRKIVRFIRNQIIIDLEKKKK